MCVFGNERKAETMIKENKMSYYNYKSAKSPSENMVLNNSSKGDSLEWRLSYGTDG